MKEIVYERTPLGQAIFNVYRKHGSRADFFKKGARDPKIIAEIRKEWDKLEGKRKR